VQYYRNRTATPGEELHQIAPNCTKLHQIAPDCGHCAKKSKKRKPGRKNCILHQSMGNPPPPGFRRRQALADKLADKSARRVDNGKWSIIPLNLRPAKNRVAPLSK
jgi:hypothetical protein